MTIYRFSAQAGVYDPSERGPLFPVVMAGLLGLWALAVMALVCGPKLAAMEAPPVKSFVSCEPANDVAAGGLLRCTVQAGGTVARDI
jgi:hypothetical protein